MLAKGEGYLYLIPLIQKADEVLRIYLESSYA